MITSFYSIDELKEIGLKEIGVNVHISRKASIYNPSQIIIGDNVRIDDFCVLSGNVKIGNYVHIAVYSAIFGGEAGVVFGDFSCISSRTAIYAKSDDYSGMSLTNPTVPDKYLGIISQRVTLGKHVLIGSGSTVLPGVDIGEGTSVGAMSLVNHSLDEWGIYAGIPCRYIKERSKHLLELEEELMNEKKR